MDIFYKIYAEIIKIISTGMLLHSYEIFQDKMDWKNINNNN
jgi:hypothetical protein